MAQERPWRPADYWPHKVYTPPPIQTNWAPEAPEVRDGAGHTLPICKVVAWALACGVVAGVAATIVASLALHLA